MKSLSTFEANLNRILRCLLGRIHLAEVLPLLIREVQRPKCLSPECVGLVQESLAKGLTHKLAQSGWHHDRFLVGGDPISGRLWQRRPPEQLGLSFSANTLKALIWLTAENAATSRTFGSVRTDSLTPADHLFNAFLFDTVQNTLVAPNLLLKPAFRDNALMWLLYPDRIAEEFDEAPGCSADFAIWFHKDNSWVMEALQGRLSQRVEAIESVKRRSADQGLVRRMGDIQSQVLSLYMKSADRAGRRDLTWFVMNGAGRVLKNFDTNTRWLSRLNVDELRLADRAQVYRSALAVFYSLEQLKQWQQESLRVGFYDDNYQASQFWKSKWESTNADHIYARAQELIQFVSPMALS